MKTYKLRIHIILIFILSFIFSLGFVFFWIKLAISRPEDLTDIGFIIASIVFLIFIGPPIILTITYFQQDLNKKVIIDKANGLIKIEKNREQYSFNRKDLIQVYHVKVDKYAASRYKFPMYEYLLFVFKEKEKLIITNLLCKPKHIIESLSLKPKMIYTNVPLIDKKLGESFLTTAQFDDKVKEFHLNFQNNTDDELMKVCGQKGYADYAKKAARQILNERGR